MPNGHSLVHGIGASNARVGMGNALLYNVLAKQKDQGVAGQEEEMESRDEALTITTEKEVAQAKDAFNDFTACHNHVTKKVDELIPPRTPLSPPGLQFEFIRIGISQPCSIGTTDISVFFTLKQLGNSSSSEGECQQVALRRLAVRFAPAQALLEARESTAEIVGCFHDALGRIWRFYAARLGGLLPATRYAYALEREANATLRFFTSPPLVGSRSTSVTDLIFIGDTLLPGAEGILRKIAGDKDQAMVIHLGDGTYATNVGDCYSQASTRNSTSPCGWACTGPHCAVSAHYSTAMLNRASKWAEVYDTSIGGEMPWMTTMGNHDNDVPWFLSMRPTCASAMPGVAPHNVVYDNIEVLQAFTNQTLLINTLHSQAVELMKNPHFYSFDYGTAHIISLGSEDNPMNAYEYWDGNPLSAELIERFDSHFGNKSRQYEWLLQDLASVDRELTPWLIVFTHRPLYSSARHHPNCMRGGDWFACLFRDTYEPVFQEFGVDIVASGHSHHYSRSYPMYKAARTNTTMRGIVHVTVGIGSLDVLGNRFMAANWVASRQGAWPGFSRMRIENATHARWTHELVNGTVFDEAWLTTGWRRG